MRTTAERLRLAVAMVGGVTLFGTIGYVIFGFTVLDALYQTVTTITTVGFRELAEFGPAEKSFTIVLIVVGVSTVLYTFTLVVQSVVEGQLSEFVGRRRMDRQINKMSGHTIVCGWGRVGAAVAHDLRMEGHEVVIVDADAERVRDVEFPRVIGDATRDETLRSAGIDRASSLIAALDGDADNLFVTLSGRDLRPDLFIVARARADESIGKLEHAGADRVVNPQELGAARMASFVASPHVAEFLDVVMHDRSIEFRMREFDVPPDSPIAGKTLRNANLREESGALVLALRAPDGSFTTNPTGDTVIGEHHVIIAVGTTADFDRLAKFATPHV
ncbi:potassium channel family protein [Ilumatobacter nonamiensis]|uniref:potassium channel family protein n=1 Tax=Ilumatobacter nonamiensis TaxID=467093 RepID=UPI00058CDF9C|nr:potassium channel protein [Ilumatobacter nonamiensis]